MKIIEKKMDTAAHANGSDTAGLIKANKNVIADAGIKSYKRKIKIVLMK